MKNFYTQLVGALLCAFFAATSYAQLGVGVSPVAPNSTDTIIVRTQFSPVPLFTGDSYRVEMVANRIRLILGSYTSVGIVPLPLPYTFEIGTLPAGTYAVDVFDTDKATGNPVLVGSSSAFTVTNGRVGKAAPYVVLNNTGQWWNPAESGWGLFIWQDRLDHVLAAWFTYGADNKPVWYTVQGGAWINAFDYQAPIYQTTGPVFSAFVPGSAVQVQAVGTAKFSLGPDTGTFTYTLNGVTQTKTISRFKP